MKAFLLAAGHGTRLRPLTETAPKCLLPIQGVPLLQIWLENCQRAGINQVLVNVHSHPAKMREFVETLNSCVEVSLAHEPQLLGSAGTLAENREFVAGEELFFVLYGDVLTNINLAEMLAFHRKKNMLATLAIHQAPDPARCGIVTTDEKGIVQSFVEKPLKPGPAETHWAFAGVMIARPEVLDFVPASRPADIGFHLLPRLVKNTAAFMVSGYLLDIGTVENYAIAQSSWPGLR